MIAHERLRTGIRRSHRLAVVRNGSSMIKNFKKLQSLIKIREKKFFSSLIFILKIKKFARKICSFFGKRSLFCSNISVFISFYNHRRTASNHCERRRTAISRSFLEVTNGQNSKLNNLKLSHYFWKINITVHDGFIFKKIYQVVKFYKCPFNFPIFYTTPVLILH
jgi:hypothetical protein